MPALIFATKVLGNTALGVWAGYNLSLAHPPRSFPPCDATKQVLNKFGLFNIKLAKPEEKTQPKSSFLGFPEIMKRAVRSLHISSLSVLTALPNLLAYFLADKSGKHPYLIYVAIGAQLVGALQFVGARDLIQQLRSEQIDDESFEHVSSSSSFNSPISDVTTSDKYAIFSTVGALLSTFLFVVGTVGLGGERA